MPAGVSLAVAAAAAVGGAVHSFVQGERAEREAKRAGRARAEELRMEAEVVRERGRRLVSSQRAGYGAAGVGLAGSPILVQAQAAYDSLLEQQALIRGSVNARRNARAQARAYGAEGIAGGIAGLGQAAGLVASPEFQRAYFTPAGSSPAGSPAPGRYHG